LRNSEINTFQFSPLFNMTRMTHRNGCDYRMKYLTTDG